MKRILPAPDFCKEGAVSVRRMPLYLSFLFLPVVFIALFPACGKKGPPFLPEKALTAKVDRLTAQWADGQIRLEGSIEGNENRSDITGCTIYHAWYPMDHPPCDGCPVELSVFTGTTETAISGDRFSCVIPAEKKKGIWFLEVRLTNSRGAVGPPSERIKLKIEY